MVLLKTIIEHVHKHVTEKTVGLNHKKKLGCKFLLETLPQEFAYIILLQLISDGWFPRILFCLLSWCCISVRFLKGKLSAC